MGTPELRIGVVGFSAQKFDKQLGQDHIVDAYDRLQAQYEDRPLSIVSGLTDLGVPALAYREAARRGWRTVGIACAEAAKFECFPVDEKKIVGDNWGDESSTFLDSIDVLVRIGGGKQAVRETTEMKFRGKQVMEYDLPAIPQEK